MPTFHLDDVDALTWLRSLPDASADLVLTDPPYPSLDRHRATGTTTRLQGGWFDTMANDDFGVLFGEAFRVLRPDRHLYMFCDAETMFVAKPAGEAAGFRFWKPIVWDKLAIGMGYHYRARCEFILFFEKGKRRLNDLGVADVLTAKRIRGGYPTEKPVALADVLVRQSTAPGELVVDPVMGREHQRCCPGRWPSLRWHRHQRGGAGPHPCSPGRRGRPRGRAAGRSGAVGAGDERVGDVRQPQAERGDPL